jgi:hypothetical protein
MTLSAAIQSTEGNFDYAIIIAFGFNFHSFIFGL